MIQFLVLPIRHIFLVYNNTRFDGTGAADQIILFDRQEIEHLAGDRKDLETYRGRLLSFGQAAVLVAPPTR